MCCLLFNLCTAINAMKTELNWVEWILYLQYFERLRKARTPMHLKSIKLAGFKSFVDPTHIPIRTYNNSIVGPNGCGKSNIIDAIRWVVGESSAKQLRGQSMSDVIFNGTTERKPVGRAMVELVFDNASGRLGGEFAKFNEVSVRRELEREGQSNYFLNGTKCRRKDILDVFLGTGLGPRSYAVIEQGMISRLIEAKPEDLRVFLEEAAGISKYKERRRETENRIRHTQENLDRVNDLCEELERQLKHLQRQANAAEKYKIYKQQERDFKSQLKALQWQEFETEIADKAQELQLHITQFEELKASLAHLEVELDKSRVQRDDLTCESSDVQRQYYEQTAEIAKLEQRIKHIQEQARQWQEQLEKADALYNEFNELASIRQEDFERLEVDIASLNPQLIQAKEQVAVLQQQQESAEMAIQEWQEQWEHFSVDAQEASKQVELDKNNLNHLVSRLQSVEQQTQQLHDEKRTIDISALTQECHDITESGAIATQQLDELQQILAAHQQQVIDWREQLRVDKNSLNEKRTQLQTAVGKQASLEALQKAALSDVNEQSTQWLNQHQLMDTPRLAQCLNVDSGWESSVETVLSDSFNAICVDDLNAIDESLLQLDKAELTVVAKSSMTSETNSALQPLASVVRCDYALPAFVQHVYVAENYQHAKGALTQLQMHESIVTKDGVWLGHGFIRLCRSTDPSKGVIVRERELVQVVADIEQLSAEIEQLQEVVEQAEQALQTAEAQRDQQQAEVNRLSADVVNLTSKQQLLQDELQRRQSRLHVIEQELSQLCEQAEQIESEIQSKNETIAELEHSHADHEQRKHELLKQRESKRELLYQVRTQLSQATTEADQLAVKLATSENQRQLIQDQLLQDQKQMQHALERKQALSSQMSTDGTPLDNLETELQQRLAQREQIQTQLSQAQAQIEQLDQQMRQWEQQRQSTSQRVSQQQNDVQQLKMDQQTLLVKQSTIIEQLQAEDVAVEAVIETMPENASIGVWMQEIETLEKRITRLGPINLAAIDEFEELSERKTYLDSQQQDLFEAIDTLEKAINKIDKETKAKFKETFEAVNEHFMRLFPSVFGGGRAELELLENDLLNAGVTVKAQPPGKRNATIHMLSGGEKALTAIALVFSFFQLNPAPFCILDEVDAPLDDLNVGRYCRLIKEMAKTTQFIVISHNKVTIASADSLIGVTMHEPGVSRMVAVDMEEAIAMADA